MEDAYKKLVFVQKIMGKDPTNIFSQTILEEVSNKINGLAYECKQIFNELEMPGILVTFASKSKIRSLILFRMNEKALNDMKDRTKVSDRITDNP